MFLGSTVAGGAATLVGGTLLVDRRASAQPQAADAAMVGELRRQLKRGVQRMSDTASGEAARSVASTLRLAAAHGAGSGFDARVKAAVRAAIQREGRAALLAREVDDRMFAAEAREFGVANPPLLRRPDLGTRDRAIDALLTGGLTPYWSHLATRFDAIAERLDRRSGVIRHVRLAEDSPECQELERECFAIEAMMILACMFPIDLGLACYFMTGVYIGFNIGMFWEGC